MDREGKKRGLVNETPEFQTESGVGLSPMGREVRVRRARWKMETDMSGCQVGRSMRAVNPAAQLVQGSIQ